MERFENAIDTLKNRQAQIVIGIETAKRNDWEYEKLEQIHNDIDDAINNLYAIREAWE